MVGVMVYIVIGFVLFTPIGFIAGYLQHKNRMKKPDDFPGTGNSNDSSKD
jgi:hypothetical protein